jgi:Phage capsid family
MNAPRPAGIPLRADPDFARRATTKSLIRACAAHLMAASNSDLGYPHEVVERTWPGDTDAHWLTKTALNPASTTSVPVLLQTALADFLIMLGPASAGAVLLSRGISLSFDQNYSLQIPSLVASAAGVDFVGEMQPIPVRQLVTGGLTLTPRKFATISTYTRETFLHSTPNIQKIVQQTLTETVALKLDSVLLDANAGDSVRPPGLRNGIASLTASSATPATEAMLADVAALVAAVAPVAGNNPIVLIASPARAAKMKLRSPQGFPFEVLGSSAVAAGDLIAIASNALASATDPVPRFNASTETVVHESDTPAQLAATGTPNTISAPARSLFQSDVLGLRLIMEVSWGLRHTSGLAWISGATW